MVDFNPILIINQKTEEDYMGGHLRSQFGEESWSKIAQKAQLCIVIW